MFGVDNWYYNAKSNARYRYRNGKWEKKYTFLRGQWGMTQDEYGILYFNDNSNQFRGDYFIPGILDKNKSCLSTGCQSQHRKRSIRISASIHSGQSWIHERRA